MTQAANAFYTFNAIGLAEDVLDTIFNITPYDCPFTNMIGKSQATGVYHEWQTEALNSVNTTPALEGDDFTPDLRNKTTRVGNRTEILKRQIQVSRTEDVVKKYGRKREMTRQLVNANKEIKRDFETASMANQAAIVGASGTGAQMRGLTAWYATNYVDATSGFVPGTSTTPATDGGTTAAPVVSSFNLLLQKIFTSGGDVDVVSVGPNVKQELSQFTVTGKTQFVDAGKSSEDTRFVNAFSLYVSDFGEVKIVPNRFQRVRDLHALDTEFFAMAWLRPVSAFEIAPTGDAYKFMVIGEGTLEVRNEASSGIYADLA